MPPINPMINARLNRPMVRGWWLLLLGLLWVGLARIPLIASARLALDSDQAVDGLTVLSLTQGHWHSHFPGTPYQGILPALLTLPVVLVFGVTPSALALGGVIAYGLAMAAIFLLVWSIWGQGVAFWSLVPLVFSSTGVLWLSGRISGGHFLTMGWWALSLLILGDLMRAPIAWKAGLLGIWCGLGYDLDRMFLPGLIGLFATLVAFGFGAGRWYARILRLAVFGVGFSLGFLPYLAGLQADPYDAYAQSHATILDQPKYGTQDWPHVKQQASCNVAMLQECLPRLISGYRYVQGKLPGERAGLQADPTPESFGPTPRQTISPSLGWFAVTCFGLGGILLLAATQELFRASTLATNSRHVPQAVRYALILTTVVSVGEFLLRANHFTSSSYRYLVLLLVPYAIGVGLFLDRLFRLGGMARKLVYLLAIGTAVGFSLDTVGWYRRLGLMGSGIQQPLQDSDDPAETWLQAHPEVQAIFGGYWDVYRLSFFSGGRVRGVPYPDYPDRFPDWSRTLAAERPRILIARNDARGPFYKALALREGGTILFERPGLWIVDWPYEPKPTPAQIQAPSPVTAEGSRTGSDTP